MVVASRLRISQWAHEDRPREKLMKNGVTNLSTAELLATLIGSGSGGYNALDLSREILRSVNHDLSQLAALDYNQFMKFTGIGKARAASIVSAMELGRRRHGQDPQSKIKISGPEDVYQMMRSCLLDKKIESFWAVYLNRAHQVVHKQLISQGGVSGTLVDPKLVFKYALDHLASALVLIHNHPSGQLNPSQADILLTKKLSAAGKTLEIAILDHIIFANSGYFSFADESLI